MIKLFYGLLVWALFVAGPAFGRTRADVLRDAAAYSNLGWTPTQENLLDIENHYAVIGTTLTPPPGEDGYDDRVFKRNSKTNLWEYSKSNWPFEVCSTCTYHGEAYAWGIDDTTTTFKDKLEEEVWVAGSAGGEIRPEGYLGFAGIDCSRFASRLIKLHPTTWTEVLKGISLPISYKDLKRGDWLFRTDLGHVLIFADEKFEEQSNINIVHSVSWAYGLRWSGESRPVLSPS